MFSLRKLHTLVGRSQVLLFKKSTFYKKSTFFYSDNVLSSKSTTLNILHSYPNIMTPLSTEKIYDLVWPSDRPYSALILLETRIHT